MELDILAFAAHRDDIEISSGGTLARMTALGRKVGVCDMSQGEMGTHGDVESRAREAETASRILKLEVRRNLEIPDAGLFNTRENRIKVVEVLRELRPRVVMMPAADYRHPDHNIMPEIIRDACFLSGLRKFHTGEAHRPKKIVWTHGPRMERHPSFVIDVTDQIETKLKAIFAYESQRPLMDELEDRVRSGARQYGFMIGKKYGEGFMQQEPFEVGDLTEISGQSI